MVLFWVKPFRDAFSFAGRSTRSEMLWFNLLLATANGAGTAIFRLGADTPAALKIVWAVLWFPPLITVSVRRLHDQDRSAWWMAIPGAAMLIFAIAAMLPQSPGGLHFSFMLWNLHPAPGLATTLLSTLFVALLLATLVLDFLPGTRGANRYGPDPRETLAPA